MKTASIALVTVGCVLIGTKAVCAQRVLDRVEQLLKRQLDAPSSAAGPAAAQANEPGYLGMVGDDRQEAGKGVRVLSVAPGGPAAAGGLQQGDLITSINGQEVRAMDDMVRAVGGLVPGANLTIVVDRGGAESRHEVTVGRRPTGRPAEDLPAPSASAGDAAPQGPRLGVRTVDVTPDAQQQNNLPERAGAMVVSIEPGASAQRAGVPLGAVITAVDGQKVSSPQELAAAIRQATSGEVELTYVAGGEESKKRLTLTPPPAEAPPPPAPTRRGRPPIAGRETRRPPAPTVAEPTSAAARIAGLEARIRELEERVENLEAAAARESK